MSTRYARRLANTDQERAVPSHESGGARLGGRHLAVLVRVKHVQTPKSVEAVWVIESATRALVIVLSRCAGRGLGQASPSQLVETMVLAAPPELRHRDNGCGCPSQEGGRGEVRRARVVQSREGGKGGAEQGGFSQAGAL
ncbi:hypothetical protein B0H10DRAFT_1940313 [Mycena sp. CBHHK59/15]|nr:hypothetical protein B0H10DRAFT_1940313 [Mycena sp. CBHHK59/15]